MLKHSELSKHNMVTLGKIRCKYQTKWLQINLWSFYMFILFSSLNNRLSGNKILGSNIFFLRIFILFLFLLAIYISASHSLVNLFFFSPEVSSWFFFPLILSVLKCAFHLYRYELILSFLPLSYFVLNESIQPGI